MWVECCTIPVDGGATCSTRRRHDRGGLEAGSYGLTTVGEMQLFSWRDAQAAQRGGTRRGVGGRRHPTRRRPESGTDPGGEEPKDLNSQARFL